MAAETQRGSLCGFGQSKCAKCDPRFLFNGWMFLYIGYPNSGFRAVNSAEPHRVFGLPLSPHLSSEHHETDPVCILRMQSSFTLLEPLHPAHFAAGVCSICEALSLLGRRCRKLRHGSERVRRGARRL